MEDIHISMLGTLQQILTMTYFSISKNSFKWQIIDSCCFKKKNEFGKESLGNTCYDGQVKMLKKSRFFLTRFG